MSSMDTTTTAGDGRRGGSGSASAANTTGPSGQPSAASVAGSPSLGASIINFQMPHTLPQMIPSLPFPNYLPTMPSLQDYVQQLATLPAGVSMPSMPNLSMPSMPSMPSIPGLTMPSMPSMPNISMPSMPTMPSFADIMSNFPTRRPIKPWPQLRNAVKTSHRRFSEIGCKVPFMFNWREDAANNRLRIYFLSSINNSAEITLIYCDFDTAAAPPTAPPVPPHQHNPPSIVANSRTHSSHSSSSAVSPSAPNRSLAPNRITSPIDIHKPIDCSLNASNEVVMNDHKASTPTANDSSMADEDDDGLDEEFMPMSGGRRDGDKDMLFNTDLNRKPEDTFRLHWKPLIITSKPSTGFGDNSGGADGGGHQKTNSREENLQLERKRIMFTGITSYEYQQKSSRFVFTAGETLYWFDDPLDQPTGDGAYPPPRTPPYLPNKLDSTTSFAKMNPQLCPSDPNLVAYVADGDLWVCNLKSGLEFRLTETKFDTDSGVMSAGLPSYVIQEEFRRYTGFWWRPDNEYDHIDSTSGDVSYSILCEFVDESEVDLMKIASWDGTVEEYRFPRPGQPNAESSLSIVTFSLNPMTQLISDVKISSLPKSLPDAFPAYEYLVRCGWHSFDALWIQLLDRSQSHLVLVMMSAQDLFPPQVVYEERTNQWINCHDVLHFYGADSAATVGEELTAGSVLKFLWSSEETGFRHLYQIEVQLVANGSNDDSMMNDDQLSDDSTVAAAVAPTCEPTLATNEDTNGAKLPKLDERSDFSTNDSQRVKSGTDYGQNSLDFQPIGTLRSKLIRKTQLTYGNWEVSDKEVWCDEPNGLVYFTGLRESPLERHLYVISVNHPKLAPKRLTAEDFSHTTIAFNTSYKYFVDIQSNITIPPFGFLQKLVARTPATTLPDAESARLFLGSSANPGEDSDQMDLLPGMSAPQLFDYRLKSGDMIYGFIFKPECMEDGVRYPVLLEIYGGPEVQLVSKSFKAVRHCRRHLLASEGYIVVALDSRGSKHRGVQFEAHCRRRLGQVEIADQVEALQWLAENTGFIDMTRVAVHGWSYGGYLSLMALAQRPDVFKCAIAGAPVTNWQLYDTGYTERYMDTPANNPDGYRLGNVMTHINSFPNEENRLLIIHGLMDENVHFAHTVQLVHALVNANKPYQLNIYPFERHSLRHSQCSEHYETLLLSFLQNNL